MAALIPDKSLAALATLKISLSNKNTTGYIRDQYRHLKADGASKN